MYARVDWSSVLLGPTNCLKYVACIKKSPRAYETLLFGNPQGNVKKCIISAVPFMHAYVFAIW